MRTSSGEVRRPVATPTPTPPRQTPGGEFESPTSQRATEASRFEASSQVPSTAVPATPPPPVKSDPTPGPSANVETDPPRRPTPAGAPPRASGLSFDEFESRSFSGQKAKFQKPPESRQPPVGLIAAGLGSIALISAGVYLSVRGDATQQTNPTHRDTPPRPLNVTGDGQAPDPGATPPGPAFSLVSINDVTLPQGVTGADNATEFARHLAASYHAGGTQRMLVTCIADHDGTTLYLHPMTPGALRGSSRGIVACAGYDLGVVPDITADGSDDVVAVGARRNQLHLIDSRTLRPNRTIEVDGVRGVASGAQVMVRGEPAIVVFAEPRGPGQPTEVLAITALSSRVLWRVRGSGRIARIGDPVELGLAVGPDANGDGVGDVVAGLGAVLDATGESPSDQRCVQLFSGADGRALWAQPYCRPRSRGEQSVSLGPDVNNDGKADVAVGTDQPPQGAAAVAILSGADGALIRQIAAPPGGAAVGFGWPVALGGDLNGDGTPELFVGTVGSQTSVRVFDATTGRPLTTLDLSGVGAGNLRVFPVPTLVAESPWSVAVASPGEGIRVYARRDTEEPL